MPRTKMFACVRLWRSFGEQTYPKRKLLYHRTRIHSLDGCAHGSAGKNGSEAKAPERQQPLPARVVISYVHFLGTTKRTQADEFIEIKNLGGSPQDLSGWQISAADPGQSFTFPEKSELDAGAVFRVYTNLESREPGCFSFGSKRAIWNDAGDLGQLFDGSGTLVAKYGYGSYETRTLESIKAACGVPDLQLICDRAQLAALSKYPGKVDFFTALERALRCLVEETVTGDRDKKARSPKRVLEKLNQQKVQLLHGADLPDAAEMKKSWVFQLLEDKGKGCRIVVDRSGAEPAIKEAV